MPVKSMTLLSQPGLLGNVPQAIYLETDDTFATVSTTGYLTKYQSNLFFFTNRQVALIKTTDQGPIWMRVVITYSGALASNYVVSLLQETAPGQVTLPTVANHLIVSTNTAGTLANLTGTAINDGSLQAGRSGVAGTLISFPATATRGSLIAAAVANTGNTNVTISNALHGQASVYSIPDGGAATNNFIISKLTGTQHITVGSLQVDAGTIASGISTGGQVGSLVAYPTTTTSGALALTAAVNASGNFNTTISNATAVGQSQVISIPDSGAATAAFLLDKSATGKSINYQLTVPSITFSSTSGVIGTTTNNNAAAGSVGELLSSTVSGGAAPGVDVATDVTSISLTAGDWDLYGDVTITTSGGGSNFFRCQTWISTTSATVPAAPNGGAYANIRGLTTGAISSTLCFTAGYTRLSVSTTTTVYLSFSLSYAGAPTIGGFLAARRAR